MVHVHGNVGELIEALRFVSPAISKDETRFYVNCVLFEIDGTGTHVVATDTYRLHYARIAPDKVHDKTLRFAIAREHIARIVKELGKKQHRHKFYFLDFETKCLKINGETIEAMESTCDYPDWRRVVPDKAKPVLSIYNKRLRAFFDIACSARCAVRLATDPDSRTLYMSQVVDFSRTAADGNIYIKQQLGHVNTNTDIEIGFDPSYIRDILRVYDADDPLVLRMANPEGPTIWSDDDDSRFVVLMPKRV